jgi:hypothetical protein
MKLSIVLILIVGAVLSTIVAATSADARPCVTRWAQQFDECNPDHGEPANWCYDDGMGGRMGQWVWKAEKAAQGVVAKLKAIAGK